MAVNPNDPRTPRAQVIDALRAGISDGTYAAGSRLPPVRDLAEHFKVAPGTVQLALDVLRQESLIFSAGNRGNFVRESAEPNQDDGLSGQVAELAGQVESLTKQVNDLTARVAAMEKDQ
jgi:DNA-binding GntR family transcriptional regulator